MIDPGHTHIASRLTGIPILEGGLMRDNGATKDAAGLPAGWRVEIGEGSLLPPGAYSMIELDAGTCVFERPGGPSFEMSAAEVIQHEKTVVLRVISQLAGNDNSNSVE